MYDTIWKQLHNLKHLDHDFNEVSNSFVYPSSYSEVFDWTNTNEYQESIQMFIALCAGFGVLFVLLISCFACCCNYVRASEIDLENDNEDSENNDIYNNYNYTNNNVNEYQQFDHTHSDNPRVSDVTTQLSKCAKCARYSMSGLILLAIIVSFAFVLILNDTIKSVQNTMNKSYDPYAACLSDGIAINATLTDALKECYNISAQTTIEDVKNTVRSIESNLTETRSFVSSYVTEGESISWQNAGDSIDIHRKQLFYVCLALTCFTLVIVLISVCTSVKINICNGIVSLLVTLGMIVLWIIASVEFGVSVELADICADPNNAVIQAINDTSFANSDNQTFAIVKYYVYCDNEHLNNPLISYVSKAYQNAINLNSSLVALEYYAKGSNVENNVKALARDYNSSLYEILALNKSLNCENINNYYEKIENDMCYELLEEWYALYVLQFVIVGFLVLRLCFTCRNSVNKRVATFVVGKNATPYKEYYDDDSNQYDAKNGVARFEL